MTVRNHLEEKDANGSIILKRIYREMGHDFAKCIQLTQDKVQWQFSKQRNGSLESTKSREFRDQLSDYGINTKTGPSRIMARINAVNNVN